VSVVVSFPLPKATLQRFDLRAKKSFGQNFLADQALVDRIAALAGPKPTQVVEIGAGLGGLTARLLARGHRVVAVERDRDMARVLRELFADALCEGTLELLEADAKTTDLAVHLRPGPAVLMGNLPYQITGALLQRAVELRDSFETNVFLVQREVADRITAAPGTKIYGALSVFCQAAFDVNRAFIVRRGAFYPQPNVDSAVVVLRRQDAPRAQETPAFRELVRRAFRERRKVLRNAWRGVLGASTLELEAAANAADVRLDARGETLDVEAFARMAAQLEGSAT
jgi:16S rRNA (adenine1518-N6/adenine1519-N6)-dimethyltransferase